MIQSVSVMKIEKGHICVCPYLLNEKLCKTIVPKKKKKKTH